MSIADQPRDQRHREQPSLFDACPGVEPSIPVSLDRGVESRNENYEAIVDRLPKSRQEVLARIIASGTRGVTVDEMCAATGKTPNKISGRVTELKQAGLVACTDEKRPTRDGGAASVLVARRFLARPMGPVDQSNSESRSHRSVTHEGTTMVRLTDAHDMPDALTRRQPPKDTDGHPLRDGETYVIGKRLYRAFEDVDSGELFIQEVHRIGVAVSGSRPQRVLEMAACAGPIRLLTDVDEIQR